MIHPQQMINCFLDYNILQSNLRAGIAGLMSANECQFFLVKGSPYEQNLALEECASGYANSHTCPTVVYLTVLFQD